MTSTSTSADGFIDLDAYSLDADDLRCLSGLVDVWQTAIRHVSPPLDGDVLMGEFLQLTAGLPISLGDEAWQFAWMRAWHRLYGQGYTQVELFRLFFSLVAACEQTLIGEEGPISRAAHASTACLRRAVIASVSCAIELGEELLQDDTGLPGELAALRYLHACADAGCRLAVLSVSLVNRDSYSQLSAGDLQHLPARLAALLVDRLHERDRVFAGREGEWLVILPDVQSLAMPGMAAESIRQSFVRPLRLLSGRRLTLDVRIGAALLPDHAGDPERVLHAARLARWDQGEGGQGFAWFTPGLDAAFRQRQRLAEALHKALCEEALRLHLQPQVRMSDGACFGAELLVRWEIADNEWVPAPTIIELIDEHGWHDLFTDWLIRAAMAIANELSAAGIDIGLSLNLTAADLQDRELPELLAQRLATWQVPGSRLTLELTESALMRDRTRGLEVMQRLRALGCRLALDDFGTGYSSLSYLASLPINELKIDRSFIVAMPGSADGLRIVRTIIDLARELDMQPLAEGVETAEQRDQLLAIGCERAQGYLYGRPMSLAEFIAWSQGPTPQ